MRDHAARAKKSEGFRRPFVDRTFGKPDGIKPPKFDLEDVEDYYTFYVMILGLSEDIFWHADISFVQSVIENKRAYDAWAAYARQREIDKGIQEAR